jgi:protein TonB
MKRNEAKVPGFDDIIFENRNRSYGAYDLRKRYRSAASMSLLGGITIFSIPFVLMLIFDPEPAAARPDDDIYVVLKPDNLINPEKIIPPEAPKPASEAPKFRYVEPKVVDDSLNLPVMMITDLVRDSVQNEKVTEKSDSIIFTEPITEIEEEMEPLIFVEERPEFPGGNSALLKYIASNTKYPGEALENNIQGKVFIKFVVTAKGTVDRIEVMKGLDPLLDAEAKRVISTLPAWKPGRQNGRAVPVWFTVPVTFEILNY